MQNEFLFKPYQYKQSEQLTEFYSAYYKWLESGAIEGKFMRTEGLCRNLTRFCHSKGYSLYQLHGEMINQFAQADMDTEFPFNSAGSYCDETILGTAHMNEHRRLWVHRHSMAGK